MTLQELRAQKAELEATIARMQREERAGAIAKIRETMAEHGLTVSDVTERSGAAKSTSLAGTKVAAKYRDPQTGQFWSGRGLRPKWLKQAIDAGKSHDDFAV